MVVIKKEPHTESFQQQNIDVNNSKDQLLHTPKNDQIGTRHSATKIPNSRPKGLTQNKISNVGNDNAVVNKPKVNFSDYILSPSNMYKEEFKEEVNSSKYSFFNGSRNLGNKSDNFSPENRSSPIVKTEPTDKGLLSFTDINKNVSEVKSEPSENNNKEKKRKRQRLENTNIKGNLKKTQLPQTSSKSNNKDNVETIPENPGNFESVESLLYEREKLGVEEEEKLFKVLFDDADPNEELEYCKEVVKYPLEEWLSKGQEFTTEHELLIKDLMKARLELSYKFEIITKTMNDRCQALLRQEDHLDGKLKQIKDIAKNMLDIL